MAIPASQLSTALEGANVEDPPHGSHSLVIILGLSFPLVASLVIVVFSMFMPFVIMTVLMIFVILLFMSSLLDFVIHRGIWKDTLREAGEFLSRYIFLCSIGNLIFGWKFWLILVHNVDALKHRVIVLELQPAKWIELCMVFSGFCLLISIPRVILHFMWFSILCYEWYISPRFLNILHGSRHMIILHFMWFSIFSHMDGKLQETNKITQTTAYARDFETGMERAQRSCLQLRYLLVRAEEVVKFLNRLMVGFIVVFVIIIWLLLTKVLPTKVIVVVTSPILAAAFKFGDTLKTMFQGIVFAYFMHPFTVGDLCIIDHIQMEVKQIGIWRTTFSKVGTEEEVLYPNSALASQAIVNLDGNLLLHDFVEFNLHYDTKGTAIKSLEDSIKRCINPEHSGSEPDPQAKMQGNQSSDLYEPNSNDENVVVTKQVQDNIKITVHFMHDKNILDMTHAEAFNEKLRRKSEILQEVANCVSE